MCIRDRARSESPHAWSRTNDRPPLATACGGRKISSAAQPNPLPLRRLRRYLRLGLQPGEGTHEWWENFLACDVLRIPGTPSAVSRIWVRVGLPAPHAEQVTEGVREGIGEISELHHSVSLASAGEA